MFSVPPATTTWASPHWIAWAASITAFSPEPQTLLTVVAPTRGGQAGADGRLPGDVLAQAGAEHVAEDDFVDLVGADAGPLQRRLDRRCFPRPAPAPRPASPRSRRWPCAPRRQARLLSTSVCTLVLADDVWPSRKPPAHATCAPRQPGTCAATLAGTARAKRGAGWG